MNGWSPGALAGLVLVALNGCGAISSTGNEDAGAGGTSAGSAGSASSNGGAGSSAGGAPAHPGGTSSGNAGSAATGGIGAGPAVTVNPSWQAELRPYGISQAGLAFLEDGAVLVHIKEQADFGHTWFTFEATGEPRSKKTSPDLTTLATSSTSPFRMMGRSW